MPNPYALLALVVLAVGLLTSGFVAGSKWEAGRQAVENQHIAEAVDAANAASAEAIAKIKVTNKTIQNEVRREIETNTVYSDCKLSGGGLLLANQALAGTQPAGDLKLPRIDAPQK